MKQIVVFIFLFLISIPTLASETAIALAEALTADFQSGKISHAEYVAYQLMGITRPNNLPQRYQPFQRPISRMGTGLSLEAYALLQSASDEERTLLQSVLYRPDYLPLSVTSPSGLFKLHYTDVGNDAAADTFITLAAQAFDASYDLIVNQLGYDPPPHDDVDGQEYDVYIYNLGDYGLTTPEGRGTEQKHAQGSLSYIQMDNNFDRTYTRGIDGMLVTTAHEFMHMVQLGYRNFSTSDFDSRWLFEGSAVWMEDFAYDDINDYLQYLPYYFSNLDRSFYTFNGLHEYGTCIFYKMLEEKYGADIIRAIWEHFAEEEVFQAVDSAMRDFGTSFSAELSSHMVWNFFTGHRADSTNYFEEGARYPSVEPAMTDTVLSSAYSSADAQLMSGTFIRLVVEDFGDLSVMPELTVPAHWMYALIRASENEEAAVTQGAGTQSLLFMDVSPSEEIYLVPTNVHVPNPGGGSEKEAFAFSISLGNLQQVQAGIQLISPNPFLPDEHLNGVKVTFRLTETTDHITYHIGTETGQIIRTEHLIFSTPKKGDFIFYWDGKNDDGHLVSSGIYILWIDADQKLEPGKIAVVR